MNFDYFDIMERYARGQMTESERSDFEQRLCTNTQLAQEWADYLLIARSVRNSLRSKSSPPQAHISQLVSDARELAKENGLLLTDEDIWDYLRGQISEAKKAALEKRRATDPGFHARVERESAIVEGIRKSRANARMIDKVRRSLQEEGFTNAIHEQIQKDISSERKHNPSGPAVKSPESDNKSLTIVLWVILALVVACIIWLIFAS